LVGVLSESSLMIIRNFSCVVGQLFQNNSDFYNPTKCSVTVVENCFIDMYWVVTVGRKYREEGRSV